MAPSPVKISHKKDGCQRQLHRFHVSRPPSYLVAGSATDLTSLVEDTFRISHCLCQGLGTPSWRPVAKQVLSDLCV